MGFDVTVANVIFFIAALTAASVALGAYWKDADHIEEARRIEGDRTDERAHTNLTIADLSYDGGADELSVDVKNNGPVVVDISELAYFVDGALLPSSSITASTIDGAALTTDILLPLETLELTFGSVTADPSYFQVVAGNGAKGNWRAP